jgi:hypothetical protein
MSGGSCPLPNTASAHAHKDTLEFGQNNSFMFLKIMKIHAIRE